MVLWFFRVINLYFLKGMFVGKWYMCDDFFKINVMIIVTNDENKNKIISFYLFESYDA
jgi:hypothetical protein